MKTECDYAGGVTGGGGMAGAACVSGGVDAGEGCGAAMAGVALVMLVTARLQLGARFR